MRPALIIAVVALFCGFVTKVCAQESKPPLKLDGHSIQVNGAQFSRDGKRIVTWSADKTVRVWDAATGKEIRKFDENWGSSTVAGISPDGKRVVVGQMFGRDVLVMDVETGRELLKLKNPTKFGPNGMEFSPDGKRILVSFIEPATCLYDVETGKELLNIDHGKYSGGSANFSPDGKWIMIYRDDSLICDAETGKVILKFETDRQPSSGYSRRFVISPDGKRLAAVDNRVGPDRYKVVLVWKVGTAKELHVLRGHEDSLQDPVFSPDGKRLATFGRDKTLRIWDPETGRELHKFTGYPDHVFKVAFSPDGKRIVVTGNKSAWVWDLE